MIIEHFEQLSPEWFAARCGVVSASNFGKIVTPTGSRSTQDTKLMYQLAAERISGTKEEAYQNAAMQRGIELEPQARKMYEFLTDAVVEQVGLCYLDDKKEVSCSPDGLLQFAKRGLEIKCPLPGTHVEYLKNGVLPTVYIPQVQGSMWVTGYHQWDFVSFCPGIRPLIFRVERDQKYIKTMEMLILDFVDKLNQLVKELS